MHCYCNKYFFPFLLCQEGKTTVGRPDADVTPDISNILRLSNTVIFYEFMQKKLDLNFVLLSLPHKV